MTPLDALEAYAARCREHAELAREQRDTLLAEASPAASPVNALDALARDLVNVRGLRVSEALDALLALGAPGPQSLAAVMAADRRGRSRRPT